MFDLVKSQIHSIHEFHLAGTAPGSEAACLHSTVAKKWRMEALTLQAPRFSSARDHSTRQADLLCTIHNHIYLSCPQGEAYAHWRMAQPALSFLGVSKGKLQTIEALLNPNVWKAAAAESSIILKKHLKQVVTEIKQASLQAGYLWASQIAGCKMTGTDISAMSVGGAAATAASEGVVTAADVPVDVAAASAVVAEPTPAAAAMAALMATPANPEGIVVDANALVVDAEGLEEAP